MAMLEKDSNNSTNAISIAESRVLLRPPMGTFCLDQLRLLSPKTWMGVSHLRSIAWPWDDMALSLVALIIPSLCYRLVRNHPFVISNNFHFMRRSSWISGAVAAAYINWIVWIGTRGLRQVAIEMYQLRFSSRIRARTLENAYTLLSDRIQKGLACRYRRYDLYLPPSGSSCSNRREGIMIIPGLGVEHLSYAGPASLLADTGCVVVVISAEPLRAATPELGLQVEILQRIQQQVDSECFPQAGSCGNSGLDDASSSSIRSWTIVGHSLGSFTATRLARPLSIRRVVMWASAPLVRLMADLSQPSADIDVLVIQGSNDSFIQRVSTPELTQKFWALLPSHCEQYIIEGGTHSGFADYQSTSFPEEMSLQSRQQQQREAVECTLDFLKRTNKQRSIS